MMVGMDERVRQDIRGQTMSRFRSRWPGAWLLIGLALLSSGCRRGRPAPGGEGPLPLKESDPADAARMLVAWALTGRHPDVWDYGQRYGVLGRFKRIILVCDDVPKG